jgi:hypothetical protein
MTKLLEALTKNVDAPSSLAPHIFYYYF